MSRSIKNTDPYLGKPIRSLQTMLRLLAQEDMQIPRVIPDGIYGPTTLQAVTAFQKRHKLPITGVVNELTWNAIVAAYDDARIRLEPAAPLLIYLGAGQQIDEDNASHVLLLQAMLLTILRRYPDLPQVSVSGVYDDGTRQTVEILQQLGGISPTESGRVDKQTWQLLAHLYRAVTTDEVTVPV